MVMLHHRDNAHFKFEGDTSNSLGDISICLIYFLSKLSGGIFHVSLVRWPINEFCLSYFSLRVPEWKRNVERLFKFRKLSYELRGDE